nr:keratin-associated protein KAP28-1 variant D [Ovis aries]
MSSNDSCSGNNDSCSLGSYCHVPVNSSTTLYFTGVNYGDAFDFSSRNKTWLLDNSPETHDKLSSYQPSSCEPTTYKTSHYSSTLNCGHRCYEQLVLSPLVRISPVLVNRQCIMCVCVCVCVCVHAHTLSHVQLFVTP